MEIRTSSNKRLAALHEAIFLHAVGLFDARLKRNQSSGRVFEQYPEEMKKQLRLLTSCDTQSERISERCL